MPAVAAPDAVNAVRAALLADATVRAAAEIGVTGNAIFAYEYPAKTAGQPIDYAAELSARTRRLVLLKPAGRRRLQDQGYALIGAPRFDVWNYGRSGNDAAALHWITYAFLKDLADARVTLSGGVVSIRSVLVEAGPIDFIDPDTNAPVVVGTYAAPVAEEFVA